MLIEWKPRAIGTNIQSEQLCWLDSPVKKSFYFDSIDIGRVELELFERLSQISLLMLMQPTTSELPQQISLLKPLDIYKIILFYLFYFFCICLIHLVGVGLLFLWVFFFLMLLFFV